MLYNVVLVSAVQQRESAISIRMSPPSGISHLPTPIPPCRSSQSISLCHTASRHAFCLPSNTHEQALLRAGHLAGSGVPPCQNKSTLMCPLWFLASWRKYCPEHTHTHTRRPSVTQRVECRQQFLEDRCEPGGRKASLRKRAGSQISFSLTCVFP